MAIEFKLPEVSEGVTKVEQKFPVRTPEKLPGC